MASYVLVHGGGHGGWCYQKVARLLRAAGHDVHTPTLTGLGERSHLLSDKVDLNMHVRDVVAMLHSEDLRDVILVGHSYGGMVITGVADRAPIALAGSCTWTPQRRSTGSRSSTLLDRSSKPFAPTAASSMASSSYCCRRLTRGCSTE